MRNRSQNDRPIEVGIFEQNGTLRITDTNLTRKLSERPQINLELVGVTMTPGGMIDSEILSKGIKQTSWPIEQVPASKYILKNKERLTDVLRDEITFQAERAVASLSPIGRINTGHRAHLDGNIQQWIQQNSAGGLAGFGRPILAVSQGDEIIILNNRAIYEASRNGSGIDEKKPYGVIMSSNGHSIVSEMYYMPTAYDFVPKTLEYPLSPPDYIKLCDGIYDKDFKDAVLTISDNLANHRGLYGTPYTAIREANGNPGIFR